MAGSPPEHGCRFFERVNRRIGVIATVAIPPITNKDTLDAFVQSMLISLPIAVALATLIAALVMRSFAEFEGALEGAEVIEETDAPEVRRSSCLRWGGNGPYTSWLL